MRDKSLIIKAFVMFDISQKIKRGANVLSKKEEFSGLISYIRNFHSFAFTVILLVMMRNFRRN